MGTPFLQKAFALSSSYKIWMLSPFLSASCFLMSLSFFSDFSTSRPLIVSVSFLLTSPSTPPASDFIDAAWSVVKIWDCGVSVGILRSLMTQTQGLCQCSSYTQDNTHNKSNISFLKFITAGTLIPFSRPRLWQSLDLSSHQSVYAVVISFLLPPSSQ